MTSNTNKDALTMAREALTIARRYVETQNIAEGMLEGFGGRKPRPSDDDLELVDAAIAALAAVPAQQQEPEIPEAAPEEDQDWEKVDGAVAFHLIERHAEDWNDAGRMMEAWAKARFTQPDTEAIRRQAREEALEQVATAIKNRAIARVILVDDAIAAIRALAGNAATQTEE